jgi:hypothetical protein
MKKTYFVIARGAADISKHALVANVDRFGLKEKHLQSSKLVTPLITYETSNVRVLKIYEISRD